MTEAAGFAWETASSTNMSKSSSSVGGSTEYSNLCLMHLLISLDITNNTNKASQYKPPPNGANSNIIANSLQEAKIWAILLRDDGTEVDLCSPKEVIEYFEDNIDKFVMDIMDEENRIRFVNVRERYYQKQKYADEYELYLLKKFYATFDKQYVTTCEEHIQKLKRLYKKKFSWDNVWNQVEKRNGFGRDTFSTCTDLYVQSMKDQREMEQMFNLLPCTSNRDYDDAKIVEVEQYLSELEELNEGWEQPKNQKEMEDFFNGTGRFKDDNIATAEEQLKPLSEVYHFPSQSQENEQGFKPEGYMHGLPFKKEKISLQPSSSSDAALESSSPLVQRNMICKRLHPLVNVNEIHPDNAGMITGMMLALEEDNSKLLHLLECPKALDAKVQEALQALKRADALFGTEKENSTPSQNNKPSINMASKTHTTCGNVNCSNKKGAMYHSNESKLLRCSRCKNMWYCSKTCQVDDWKRHKRMECFVCTT